jgi:PilZ domain
MEEKRAERRRRVLKSARIVFAGHTSEIDCQVRDLTDQGACLLVSSPVGIPQEFELAISGEHALRRARIIWRKADRIGIGFDDVAVTK